MYRFICKFALLATIPALILTFAVDRSLSNGGSYLAKQTNQSEEEVREFVNQFMQALITINQDQLRQMTVDEAAENIVERLDDFSSDEIQSMRETLRNLEWEIIEVQVDMTMNQAKVRMRDRVDDSTDRWNNIEIFLRISDGNWVIYNFRDVREPQTITASRVADLGMAIEQYIMDHPATGAPVVADIQELYNILLAEEILDDDSGDLIRDGWGNLLVYQRTGPREYTLLSYGSDGAEGPPVEPNESGQYITSQPEHDIIWSNGHLVQRPEGP